MSKISQFAEAQRNYNARMETAFATLQTAADGITTDMQTMSDKIDELQNSNGEISAEDQATLDELTTTKEAMTTKVEAFAAAMKLLDDTRPPAIPNVE